MDVRETLHLSRRATYLTVLAVGAWILFPYVLLHMPRANSHPTGKWDLLLGMIYPGISLARVLLSWWYERVEVDDEGLVRYSALNRPRPKIRFDEISTYRQFRGKWVLVRDGRTPLIPDIEFSELHRIIAMRAPKALRAKRIAQGLVPPHEEFEDLSIFDWQSFGRQAAVGCAVGGALALALPWASLLFLVCFAGYSGYSLLDLGGRLSVDRQGVHLRWPWQTKQILWGDAVAIFCDRSGRSRRFIVTSETASIVIPANLARNPVLMLKVIRSLPAGTLCVNFENNMKGGWRRGKRRQLPAILTPATPEFSPAF